MHHQNALATKASERYLLGEMDEPERFEFEAHYFDCPACAEDVRTGVAMARGIKAVCAEDAALRPHISVVREAATWMAVLAVSGGARALGAIGLGVAGWQGWF
jgi:anti-sigma factor RsiW